LKTKLENQDVTVDLTQDLESVDYVAEHQESARDQDIIEHQAPTQDQIIVGE